ncbi:MAG TPA: hypothetical protein VNP04_24515 [Alphaproteobacteria bacterium]|nr:hypothetical protein [Alphaproteobacteria bacterium]
MPQTLRKTMGLALAGFLMMAPLGWAAGGTSGSPSGQTSPGAGTTTGQPSMQMPRTGAGTMGQQAEDRLQATVESIDQSEGTLELRLDAGERVQFKVPQDKRQMLSGLNKGDRVQVAIEKASGMQGRTPGSASPQPGQTR